MEWVSIKPSGRGGGIAVPVAQQIFSVLTKAGFQLEQLRRNISSDTEEYFYYHPERRIQVHEVRESTDGAAQFFIFYANGSTAYAQDVKRLQALLATLCR